MSGLHTQHGRVVLLDELGQAHGSAGKEAIHGADTPLHLAFSCYLYNPDGELLLTRRALSKRSWPGVWTNSFCGHPEPDELITDAIVRHAQTELGLTFEPIANELLLSLPDFRYRAVDAGGTVENEICPVYRATTNATPVPNPDEVMELVWVQPQALAAAVELTPWAFSPWMVLQMRALYSQENSVNTGEELGVPR